MVTMDSIPATPLDAVAMSIRDEYTRWRRLQYPHYRPDPKRWNAVWRNAAERCAALRVTPEQLVRAAFSVVRPFPFPNHLCSAAVLAAVRGTPDGDDISELEFRLELSEFQHWTSAMGNSPRDVLLSLTRELSPLFRWSMARKLELDDVCACFHGAAMAELTIRSPRYLKLLPVVPEKVLP